jgi:tyrosyl-tRNA synthetase
MTLNNYKEYLCPKKMSKSNPDSAIFMTDTLADIQRKIKKAYCPEKIVEENPVLQIVNLILFPYII